MSVLVKGIAAVNKSYLISTAEINLYLCFLQNINCPVTSDFSSRDQA